MKQEKTAQIIKNTEYYLNKKIEQYLTNDLKHQEWRFKEALKKDNQVLAFKARAVIEARKQDLKQLKQLNK